MYSLGIGTNIDPTQLNDIASSNNNVFTAASFAALTPVAKSIVQNSCPGRLSWGFQNTLGISACYFRRSSLGCETNHNWQIVRLHCLSVLHCLRVGNYKCYL